MTRDTLDHAIVVTLARTAEERAGAQLLIDSVRTFGGELSRCPIWRFETHPHKAPHDELEEPGLRVFSLDVPETVKTYYYADKVYAAAQAEEMAPPGVNSLIWIDPTCLIVQPPTLYDLGVSYDAAVRPVHIKNVGLVSTEPLDDFWTQIYETVGVRDMPTTVETFVDRQRIRAYFNSHAFAVRPSTGLLRRWFVDFEALTCDEDYQAHACQDTLHQVFLHAALLSALLATQLEPPRLRSLPPEYNYPYNLHASVPPGRRATALNDLVCFTYEGRALDPTQVDDVEIHEPLRSWLSTQHAQSHLA